MQDDEVSAAFFFINLDTGLVTVCVFIFFETKKDIAIRLVKDHIGQMDINKNARRSLSRARNLCLLTYFRSLHTNRALLFFFL